MSEKGGYREKYVLAIKEQERMEQQHKFQMELLKKTLFQMAAAASGMDTKVDASVLRLKEVMRGGSGAQAVEQMDRLADAIQLFERTRSQENNKAASAVKLLIEQYQSLQLPKDVKSSLSTFSSALKKRLSNYRQYPLVLDELAKLQRLALDAASNPNPGFWARIKGGKTINVAQGDEASAGVESIDISDVAASATESDAGTDAQQASTIDLDVETELSSGELIRSGLSDDEDSYEKVAGRIAQTLANLVDKIEPNDVIKHRVDIVRLRIKRGMDWYVLAVTLEDIRDILFLRYLQADEEFSEYLNQLRAELGTIRQALMGAVEHDATQTEATNTFTDRVSSGVERMRASVANEQNVDNLKQEVTEHISFISEALQDFKARPQISLTQQLEQLVQKVKSVEKESEETREALEEQRHKATHDALTGLPNREAYMERVFQEMQRYQRYERPLTMAVCDIDHFKSINDNYGHQAGDKVLKLIAKLISTRLRNVDFIARIGGEEFVILMPETQVEQAHKVLDKIRAVIGKTPFRFKADPVNITISFGLVAFTKEDTVDSAFERADKALYKAKNTGRNQCIIAD